MAWWATGPAGATSAAGTQEAPNLRTARKDAAAYGETVLGGPFATQAEAQAWTASAGGGQPPPIRTRGSRLTGQLLARIAKRYRGAGYVYGGNASAVGLWDCSSFVSFCLHQAGLALPGGKWGDPGMPPNVHGPVVVTYADWAGATTVGTPQAGDLCCYVGVGVHGHIGIAISGTRMVSALNPSSGTLETDIFPGSPGEPLIYRRINGLAGGVPLPVAAGPGAAHPPLVALAGAAVLLAGALLLAVAGMAAVVAGATWAIRELAK